MFSLIQHHNISIVSCRERALPRLQGRKDECLVRYAMIRKFLRYSQLLIPSTDFLNYMLRLELTQGPIKGAMLRLWWFNSTYLLSRLQPTKSIFFLPINSAGFSESTALSAAFSNTVRQLGWIQFFVMRANFWLLMVETAAGDCDINLAKVRKN